jgi:L-alanine-DL-glutamate epimerase-like enolase superfamily enzyme
MTAPRLTVMEITRRERPFRLRLPFRFGVTTATHGRQAVVAVRVRLEDGRQQTGYAAEALGAKWFDKNLALSDEENHHQLRRSLELAGDAYLAAQPSTAFDLFAENHQSHTRACGRQALNPLIASYGPALLDRAILDALCRAHAISFYEAIGLNLPGIRPHASVPELSGFPFGKFLSDLSPSETIHVRHTVGLADAITSADQAQRIGDGLPETLEEVIGTYGNRYFKLKVSGDDEADLDRLEQIAEVLERAGAAYFVTLDGNEQYHDAEAAAAFFEKLGERDRLARLASSILYVEQPVTRDEALARPIDGLAAFAPVIIDESDAELCSFPIARDLGYSGVSSKTCKGIYKSILNLARCALWNADHGQRYFMSAEDLTCEPGVALQQDLALVTLLGLQHVERNAHHFIDGFAGRPASEAGAYHAAHSDLYQERNGKVRLRIDAGQLAIRSLDCVGYASTVAPVLEATEPMPKAVWPTESGDAA